MNSSRLKTANLHLLLTPSFQHQNGHNPSYDALSVLKSSDLFMYYSIPALQDAASCDRQSDLSVLAASTTGGTLSTGLVGSSDSQVVTRQTRISYKCHLKVFPFDDGYLMAEVDDNIDDE